MEYAMRLATEAAEALGYREQKTFLDRERIWRPERVGKLLKHQREPRVVWKPGSVEVTAPNWSVTVYLHHDPLTGGMIHDGISVIGDPGSGMDRVFSAWNDPDIERKYRDKLSWLKQNPGFWVQVAPKSRERRVNPRQLEVG